MGSFTLSMSPSPSKALAVASPSLPLLPPAQRSVSFACSSSGRVGGRACFFVSITPVARRRACKELQVVAMAPEEEKLTRRNPLDFPIEWERPKPGRRPDIFPQFSPMKTPLPPPMPYDPPPEEDEEEEEEKEEEEEENPDKEEEDEPDKKQNVSVQFH